MREFKTAAIYTRYSSNNQREESNEAQVRACTKYAKEKGFTILHIYSDSAKSATTADRPEFQKMIADSAKKEFSYLIIHKLDRFSRDRYDSMSYKRKLKKNGVTLCSVLENIDNSPESIMMESVLEGMAEYYSRNLAREVQKGQRETALKCKHCGGIPPLGYNVDKITHRYIINETEANTIRTIFTQYLNGMGYSQLLEYLNSNGYKTKVGKPFKQNSLNGLLNNEKYSGVYIFNQKQERDDYHKRAPKKRPLEEVIRIEGGMPAIIDKETFQKVQDKLRDNKERAGAFKAKSIYLLSGLVYCGECGEPMYGNFRYGGRSKLPYASYKCSGRGKHLGCKNKELRREYLDDFVLEALKSVLFSSEAIKKLAKQLQEYNVSALTKEKMELNQVKEELQKTDRKISNILDSIAEYGLQSDTFKNKLNLLEIDKSKYKERMEQLHRSIRTIDIDENTIKDLISRSQEFILTKNIPECRHLLKNYINKVLVYQDKVEIFFKLPIESEDEKTEIDLPFKATEDIGTLKRDFKSLLDNPGYTKVAIL